MSKLVMIFASMSGNTEEMADHIAGVIRETENEIEVIDIMDSPEASILEQYDGIILGAYTWGDGDLPDDFLDFYDAMDSIDLTGKKAAVFGSCDSAYPKYGVAVDILIEKLQERGAAVVLEGLKVELTPEDEDVEKCLQFGAKFVKHLS
ncbi:flavodoxin [Bacillus thuringiensis]|uniref:Flavodoxin n=6 Tax=Bacillus cereus group TaxID=86661 RepID=A0A9W7Q8S9_BACCE|nr:MULTISPECIES: flavodoxin [Bacillus]ACK97853.1 flavodoxin [Bacillus cereus G9842]AFQ16225.1 flavodoxin [Bacillus thuringiensis HD-771]AJQ58138.1 flavodoxin [Bacillus thuringiensis serovar morrisoni]AMR83843.1 flavodoxin [Bacillus thuringiensis]AND06976.1 flavodoxin [Bacillus thuringiensis serovar alesti]